VREGERGRERERDGVREMAREMAREREGVMGGWAHLVWGVIIVLILHVVLLDVIVIVGAVCCGASSSELTPASRHRTMPPALLLMLPLMLLSLLLRGWGRARRFLQRLDALSTPLTHHLAQMLPTLHTLHPSQVDGASVCMVSGEAYT
jgi:hypothetical protein